MGKSQKNYMSIKSKLMAAVAMLLVASFMVVSSTYAWFTLSTAPEVTGITTSVGSNGNLEIALLTSTDSTVSDLATLATATTTSQSTIEALIERNKTWGNLVTISGAGNDDPYGLKNISLLPSRLALASATALYTTAPISVPTYGADGRMSGLVNSSLYGVYDNTGFTSTGTGVRGIGTKSSMTQQELDFRTASQGYTSNLNKAYNIAQTTLQANTEALMNIIVAKSTDATEYDATPLGNMITALEGGVVSSLTEARENLIKAVFISQFTNYTAEGQPLATGYLSPKDVTVAADGTATIAFTDAISIQIDADDIPAAAKDIYNGLNGKIAAIEKAIADAKSAYAIVEAGDETKATWENTSAVMSYLLDANKLKLGGATIEAIKADLQAQGKTDAAAAAPYIIEKYTTKGDDGVTRFIVTLPEGSGVFADIHQVTGKVIRGSATYIAFPVNIETEVAPASCYVFTIAKSADNADAMITYPVTSNADQSPYLTDLYAYALDLAFRTNAQNSFLQLQTTAKNRIYSEGGVEETMGSGSVMKFKTDDAQNFGVEDVKNLMKSVRIVFVDASGEILAVAGADTDVNGAVNATVDAEGNVTADIVLYNYTFAYAAEDDENTTENETLNNGKLTLGAKKTNDESTEDKDESVAIVELERNTATAISAYVYLDGDSVDNGDVAIGESSMTGSINLQFSSSAILVPMNYAEFQGQQTATETTTVTPTP